MPSCVIEVLLYGKQFHASDGRAPNPRDALIMISVPSACNLGSNPGSVQTGLQSTGESGILDLLV